MSEEIKRRGRPPASGNVEKELDNAEKQFDKFKENVETLTLDRMNQEAKREEVEPQTKLSQKEIAESKDIYLKPVRMIASKETFNERLKEKYNFDKEYVYFIAENKEIIGETIECWTKKYPGLPAEFWKVPVNKPVWGPRYLAEQIKSCYYHRLKTEDRIISDEAGVKYTGQLVVDTVVNRMDAMPATKQRSIFMGSTF